MDPPENSIAFGAPGIEPRWTSSAKEGRDSLVAQAVGREWKGKLSLVLYLAAIPLAFISPWIASTLYVFGALLWLIPDPRIERKLEKRDQ